MPEVRKTVLVLDDEPAIVEILCATIDNDEFRALGVSAPGEALRLAGTVAPALVLCDWSMPEMDGAEFIERLRANEATSHLPVGLMSGYLPPDLKKLGATAFLQKPFQIEDVISLVTALATSNSSESEPELALGR